MRCAARRRDRRGGEKHGRRWSRFVVPLRVVLPSLRASAARRSDDPRSRDRSDQEGSVASRTRLSSAATAITTSFAEAPLADRTDRAELGPEQIGAEPGPAERDHDPRVAAATPRERGRSERAVRDQSEHGHGDARELRVARALHRLAAARGADRRDVRVVRVRQVRGDHRPGDRRDENRRANRGSLQRCAERGTEVCGSRLGPRAAAAATAGAGARTSACPEPAPRRHPCRTRRAPPSPAWRGMRRGSPTRRRRRSARRS